MSRIPGVAYCFFRTKKIVSGRKRRPTRIGFPLSGASTPFFGIFVKEGTVDSAVRFDGEAVNKISKRHRHVDQGVEHPYVRDEAFVRIPALRRHSSASLPLRARGAGSTFGSQSTTA